MSDEESAAASRRLIFGRRRGRKFSPARETAFADWLPRLRIALPAKDGDVLDPAALFAQPMREYWVEVGFGDGQHLFALAEANPDVGFLGVEPYEPGVAKLVSRIAARVEAGGPDNIRILTDDARLLLKALPDRSIARGFTLFPDPWPKKRHQWRRIVNAETLQQWARLIPPGGALRLATDVPDYQRWMLRHILAEPRFDWLAETSADWLRRPADWPASKYEQKAIAAGRTPHYYRLRRI